MKNGSVTIAIVDDHSLIRKTVHFRLSRMGYDVVIEAENGKDFLDRLSKATTPHICLLDINMPVMDGFETIVHLKKNWPDMKVLFFSMHNSQVYMKKAMELGADGYVAKDASTEELETALAKCIHQPQVACA